MPLCILDDVLTLFHHTIHRQDKTKRILIHRSYTVQKIFCISMVLPTSTYCVNNTNREMDIKLGSNAQYCTITIRRCSMFISGAKSLPASVKNVNKISLIYMVFGLIQLFLNSYFVGTQLYTLNLNYIHHGF